MHLLSAQHALLRHCERIVQVRVKAALRANTTPNTLLIAVSLLADDDQRSSASFSEHSGGGDMFPEAAGRLQHKIEYSYAMPAQFSTFDPKVCFTRLISL